MLRFDVGVEGRVAEVGLAARANEIPPLPVLPGAPLLLLLSLKLLLFRI